MARRDPTATFEQREPPPEPRVPSPAEGTLTVEGSPERLDDVSPSRVRLEPTTTGEVAAILGASERYRHQGVVGKGGMGTVLLVQDRVIGRRVALKQLREERAGDAASRARFAQEARLQGQLEHPAIVPVYDIGVDAEGNPFFTMRRVRGQGLDEILSDMAIGRPTRFTRRKLLTAFSQLCLAVHYAHENGVVHRDIKPSNVMLGRYGEVYLLDWGIAKVADEGGRVPRESFDELQTPSAPPTGRGSVMGSLVTMAPEQALGTDIDARADVYALGAVLFEILTFESLHPVGTFSEVVKMIVLGIEARPSLRVPKAEVPPELEAVVVQATKLHPDDRFQTALAMHEQLEAYLEGDRDEELRREGARRHAEAARVAADAALGDGRAPDEDARAVALREVGRALALDPDNATALGTFVRLLTTPPKDLPREVREEDRLALVRRIRMGAIAAASLYGYISVNALFTLYLGVRDVPRFTLAHVGWATAMGLGILGVVRPSYRTLFALMVVGTTTSVYLTGIYGPFLIVPTLLGVHAALFALVREWHLRLAGIGLTGIGWTISVFGERYGLFPTIVTYAGGDLAMRSPVVELPAGSTTFFMYSAVLTSILAPALVIGALRSASAKNELAARLQAWQLRQLVARSGPDAGGADDARRG